MEKVSIGVDIGTKYLKVVCLGKRGDKLSLVGYGLFDHRGDVERLASFLKDTEIPSGDVRINIEAPSLKVRRVDIPVMSDEEVPEAVKWSLKDVVGGDVDDYLFRDYRINSEDLSVGGKLPVVAFAIKKEDVDERIRFARKMGLKKPSVVEPNTAAMASIFFSNKGFGHEGDNVLMDIGHKVGRFVVMGKRGLLFSRPMDGCSGEHLLDQIALAFECETAHSMKIMRKFIKGELLEGQEREKMKAVVSSFFSRVAVEIQRSMDGFSLIFQGRQIGIIYLSGGGAYYNGLPAHLGKTLGIETQIFDPFKFIDLGLYNPEHMDKTRALFTVACGLAVD